jgi:hypothetical protein
MADDEDRRYIYWNRDFSKLVPLDSDAQFAMDMAGMKAMRDIIWPPAKEIDVTKIRDAVAEDIADKFGKDDE